MRRHDLFGEHPASAVAIVEPPMSRSYARKARIAFYAVTAAVGALAVVVLSTVVHVLAAVVFGVLAGAVCGLSVALAVRAWPVLRALWHWAAEIVLLATVVAGWAAAASATHPVVAARLGLVRRWRDWAGRPSAAPADRLVLVCGRAASAAAVLLGVRPVGGPSARESAADPGGPADAGRGAGVGVAAPGAGSVRSGRQDRQVGGGLLGR